MKQACTAFGFCIFSLLSFAAHAEVRNCNGVWTDKPCDGIAVIGTETPAYTKVHDDPIDSDKETMRRLYHDLDMRRLKARREHNIQLEVGAAVDSCIGVKASLDTCRTITTDLHESLSNRLHEVEMLKEQKRSNEIAEKNSQEASHNIQTNITIYDSDRDLRRPHRHPYGHDYIEPPRRRPSPRPQPPKDFKPQNRFQAGDGFPNR